MKMFKYKVSILVPIYNVENYIESCACSLFEQTMEEIEYVFIDDCGTDNSISLLNNILEKYPERKDNVRVIHNLRNLGIGQSRNKAVENALGEYLYYVDSDDFIEKNTIQLLYDEAKKNDLDIVAAEFYLFYPNGTKIRTNYLISDVPESFFFQLLNKQIPSYLCNKLIRRSLYIDNEIKVPEGVNFMEDFATLPRLVFHSRKIAYLPIPLYYYRQNQNSYCNSLKKSSIISAFKAIETIETFLNSKANMKLKDYSLDLQYCKLQTKLMLSYAAPELAEVICNYYPLLELGELSYRFNYRERILLKYITKKKYKKIRILVWIMKRASRLKATIQRLFDK